MTTREEALPESVIGSDVQLLIMLLKLSSVISRPMQDGVAETRDLSTSELRILMSIGGEGPLAGHDMSEMMAIPPMNVSRALAILEERGWTERVIDPVNRRRRPVQLSDAGWEAYRSMIPDVRAVAEFLLAPLNSTERATLRKVVAKLTDRIAAWDDNRGS